MLAFVGTINSFGFQFAPKNWMLAWGQIASIAQNQALFSLLGTTYGGNGTTTFALPDMRGRLAVSQGQGPGTSNYVMGEAIGSENRTLISTNLPIHTHSLTATSTPATATAPSNTVMLAAPNGEDANLGAVTVKMYSPGPLNTPLAFQACGIAGGNQPTPILQPLLGINFSVCLFGIYPSRN
jgi:microcystin-dependent protein